MPRRTKEELLAEFHRLSDVLEIMWDILCEMEPERAEFSHLVTSRAEMLKAVENKDATLSTVLAGVTQAINHYAIGFEMCSSSEAITRETFLGHYRRRTNRDFFDDIGRPEAQAKAILRRGRISDETEFHLLNEYVVNLDQTVLSGSQLAKAVDLVENFSVERP